MGCIDKPKRQSVLITSPSIMASSANPPRSRTLGKYRAAVYEVAYLTQQLANYWENNDMYKRLADRNPISADNIAKNFRCDFHTIGLQGELAKLDIKVTQLRPLAVQLKGEVYVTNIEATSTENGKADANSDFPKGK